MRPLGRPPGRPPGRDTAGRKATGFPLGPGGSGASVPDWVMVQEGVLAAMDLDFVNNRAWVGGKAMPITSVPGLSAARLDSGGVEVLAATPDDLIVNVSAIPSFNAASFSVVAHATCAADAAANYALWGVDDGGADNRHVAFRNTTPRIVGFSGVGGGTDLIVSDTNAAVANGVTFKTAFATAANNLAQSVAGNAAIADTSGAVPTGMTRFTVGRDHATAYWEGKIRRLTYFNVRLSNASLVALST
jgi:hypothetical protein